MKKANIEFIQAQQISKEVQAEKKKHEQEFKEQLAEARKDFDSILYDDPENFNYSNIEEMMLSHGLEMDYVEDWLI